MTEEKDDVPTESSEPNLKKAKKPIVFARALTATEVFTPEAKQSFDRLPAWQRHLCKRLIEHGDLIRAAKEAGAGRMCQEIDVKQVEQKSIVEELERNNVTPQFLVTHLKDCLDAVTIKYDKHNNPVQCVDLQAKIKTLELIFKLRGDFDKASQITNKKAEELFNDTPID